MAGAIGGLVSCRPGPMAGRLKHPFDPGILSVSQADLLAILVETIIPATDTPGAKALKVDQFVQKIVAECYPKTRRTPFRRSRCAGWSGPDTSANPLAKATLHNVRPCLHNWVNGPDETERVLFPGEKLYHSGVPEFGICNDQPDALPVYSRPLLWLVPVPPKTTTQR